jgi:hypothetical protein
MIDATDLPREDFGVVGAGGYIAARSEVTLAAGVDLGQAIDSSTICVLRKVRLPTELVAGDAATLGPDLRQKLGPAKIYLEHAERLPLNMSYVAQAARIKQVSMMPNYRGATWLTDRTGVGRGVVDILTDTYNLHTKRVCITSGRNIGRDRDGSITVPKIDLMAAVMASFAQKELRISPKLSDYVEVMKQLRAMQSQYTQNANITFNAASGQHDDYVIAIALALFHLNPPRTGMRWSGSALSDLIR